MRLAPFLVALLAPAAALGSTSAAPGGELRVGVEAGATWYGSRPNNGTGPAGVLRARWQPLDRLALSAGLMATRQPRSDGGSFQAVLVPVALEIRVDRAPVAPYLSLGWALASFRLEDVRGAARGVPLDYEHGPTLGLGVEVQLSAQVALTAQATYFGFGALAPQQQSFPFTSAITAGVEACLF